MTSDPITINFETLETYEAGAILLSLLAYPEADSDQQRWDAQVSLSSIVLRAQRAADPAWAERPQRIKPIYALQETKDASKALRKFKRCLRDRMIAGKMAIAFLKEAAGHEIKATQLPSGRKLSLNLLSELVRSESNQTDSENVETRVWRASLPVIHLAAATQLLLSEVERMGLGPIGIGNLLTDPSTVIWVVDNAESIARDLAAYLPARVPADQLIRIQRVPA